MAIFTVAVNAVTESDTTFTSIAPTADGLSAGNLSSRKEPLDTRDRMELWEVIPW